MNSKKLLSYPGKVAVAYMLFTVLLFLLGPIKWKVPSETKLVLFLLVYIAAFAFGYFYQMQKRIRRMKPGELEAGCDPASPDFGFLRTLPFRSVRLVFVVSCIFSIVRGIIIASHLSESIDVEALLRFDLASSYFSRLEAAPWGTWYVLALNIVYFLELFWYILAILYYKQMTAPYKLLLFATACVNVVYCLFAGEMINWGVYIFRLMPICILLFYAIGFTKKKKSVLDAEKTTKKKKRTSPKKLLFSILIFVVLFLMMFSFMQESRSDYLGEDELSYSERAEISRFIEEERRLPVLDSLLYPMDFYITQGYCAMGYALELPPKFTYGIGHSRDLTNYLLNYTGIDITGDIYPQRLEDAYGWDNGMFWPSAFTWFASDWTFYGIPVLMFIFGMFFCNVWFSALFENSIVAVTLFSWLWVGIFFISANNQLFQSFQVCMGTIVLIILYVLRKTLPRIVA